MKRLKKVYSLEVGNVADVDPMLLATAAALTLLGLSGVEDSYWGRISSDIDIIVNTYWRYPPEIPWVVEVCLPRGDFGIKGLSSQGRHNGRPRFRRMYARNEISVVSFLRRFL